jgi:putative transcriptional regulator
MLSYAAAATLVPQAAEETSRGDAAYARGIRARTKLTQAEFAASIDVPIETVRNWEQGKRSPRGPARALLKVIDKAPHIAFAVLRTTKVPH